MTHRNRNSVCARCHKQAEVRREILVGHDAFYTVACNCTAMTHPDKSVAWSDWRRGTARELRFRANKARREIVRRNKAIRAVREEW